MFLTGIFLLATVVICTALFYGYDLEQELSKKELAERIAREQFFEQDVEAARPGIDTVYKRILAFNPSVRASFLENDINNALNAVRSVYERKPQDLRYKIFVQVPELYTRLFYDRKELRGNHNDVNSLTRVLEDCKLRRRQLQQSLSNSVE